MGTLLDSGFTLNNSAKTDKDDDIGVIRSTLSGIASGVFKIPEGAFSLGATLIDFGLGTNTAAGVEKFFDTINIFDEAAEATAAGKIAELIVNVGVPVGGVVPPPPVGGAGIGVLAITFFLYFLVLSSSLLRL